MARGKAKRVSQAQRLTGYGILTLLGLIAIWLGVQQAHFNPALTARQSPGLVLWTKAAASGLTATAGFIPEAPGFTPLGPPQSYNAATLSDKINGKAELYLSAGFKEMSCRSFTLETPKGAHLEVFIYDMGEASNAYAVFSSQRRPGAASLALTANAYATPNALFFTHGAFYVEMVADRAIEDLPAALAPLTTALLAKLPAAAEARDATALFPREGLMADSVRLNAADAFGLEGFDNVYTGEYAVNGGRATAFLAERQSPAAAEAAAKKFRDFLMANGYQEVETSGLPAGTIVLEMDGAIDVIMVRGPMVFGVHDAAAKAEALALAARLNQAMAGAP